MPYNLKPASVAAGAVLPPSLSTSFVETYVYPLLSTMYNDGSFERSLIVDGVNPARALRVWVLAKRLTTVQLTALQNFWENTVQGGLYPFYFYDPFDIAPGHHVGSNYDATGNNTQGRVIVFFRGDWAQRTELGGGKRPGIDNDGRHIVPSLTLVEVA